VKADMLAAAMLAAQADPRGVAPIAVWQPLARTTTRYGEDWSVERGNPHPQWTDRLKYIPLGNDAYLTTGLEVRLREEKFSNNWAAPEAPDDGYLWSRALPYADLHVGPMRSFVQLNIAYANGVRPAAGPVDRTGIDLLQAFADFRVSVGAGTKVTVRAGRELLSLGSERLVGTRYGPNVLRAFDGARAIVTTRGVTTNLFYVRPVQGGLHDFDDRTSKAKALWGAYGSAPHLLGTWGGIDAYALGYRNERGVFDQGTGREMRQTLGLRWYRSGDWHWNIEAMVQRGRFAGAPIRAWSVGSEAGRRIARLPLKPDFTVRFNLISGDKNPADRRLGTFNAMFPKGKYFGEFSPIGPYNLINVHPGVALDLGHRLTAIVAGMAYWRESRRDGIYDIPGHLLRSGRTAQARFVGKQIEATLAWQATAELGLSGSLSAFEAGRFLHETGPARTSTMIGLESNLRF